MQEIKENYIMPTYGNRTLEFSRGMGCHLFTTNDEKYLDFAGGIAVNSLGHCHPVLVQTLKEQAEKLWHTSNLYLNKDQEDYAKLLCDNSFADKVFFCNSGAEAIECGIKVIRSYHNKNNNNEKKNIITFQGAFHGRTFAALSAQKNSKYSKGFEPLMTGFIQAPFNDITILNKLIDNNTAAILIEPIQGEGGIRPANLEFLKSIKQICIKNDILLFLDEVQSGFGRSGKLFAYEWAEIEPDIMAVAKGIGSGFPMGACLSTSLACKGMTKGMHGSTYGGNPLSVAVGRSVLKIIKEKIFLDNVNTVSKYLWHKLKEIEIKYDEIIEVRGAGLLLGIKTRTDNIKISSLLIKNKLLNVPAADNVIRFAPPLIITFKEAEEAVKIIAKTFKELYD